MFIIWFYVSLFAMCLQAFLTGMALLIDSLTKLIEASAARVKARHLRTPSIGHGNGLQKSGRKDLDEFLRRARSTDPRTNGRIPQ
jgi:hypothetical protein